MATKIAKYAILTINALFGLLFAYVAVAPIRGLFLGESGFQFRYALEAALLFSAIAFAFLFGAWVLFRTWPRMWRLQVVPLIGALGAAWILVSG